MEYRYSSFVGRAHTFLTSLPKVLFGKARHRSVMGSHRTCKIGFNLMIQSYPMKMAMSFGGRLGGRPFSPAQGHEYTDLLFFKKT